VAQYGLYISCNTPRETEKMTAPKKAKFDRITEADGYKLIPANKTAEKFCAAYGTAEIRISEALTIGIRYENINWART
jgi:hypothetical protein